MGLGFLRGAGGLRDTVTLFSLCGLEMSREGGGN